MFHRIGRVVAHGAPIIVVIWSTVLALLWWLAPPFREVVLDREFAYLPKDSPSQIGEAEFRKAFPREFRPSNLVIVFYRDDRALTSEDFAFIEQNVRPGLLQIAADEGGLRDQAAADRHKKSIICEINTFKEQGIGALLVSQDKRATLVDVELSTELMEYRNWSTLEKINDLLKRLQSDGKMPAGLQYAQAGSAAIGYDTTTAESRSAKATQIWTVVFVVVLLLILYRSPVLALVPLISLVVAVQVALSVLALLGEAHILTLFQGMQVYTAIILYGTGIDYGLFLLARYREELVHEEDTATALAKAMGHVGIALTASAATVAFSIGMMASARFGEFHEAGVSITLSLLIGWCAALTLMPAMLRLIGRRLAMGSWFLGWVPAAPVRSTGSAGPDPAAPKLASFIPWSRLARLLERWPGTILAVSILLMVPLALHGFQQRDHLAFDLVKRPLADAPSIVGTKVLAEHFPEGLLAPVVVLLHQPGFQFQSDRGQDAIADLSDGLLRHKEELDLGDLRSLTYPLGVSPAAQDAMDALARKQETESLEQKKIAYYVGQGNVTQLHLVLTGNPMSKKSLDLMDRLTDTVRAELPYDIRHANIEVLGLTSSIHDMRAVTTSDQTRIEMLVTASVFVILLLLLRRLIVSLYLIASVLLSFFCTLGATFLVFWALDPVSFSGLDWKVPIFLFVILMAIGADYNIFLMTRIHEEQEHLDPVGAVTSALVKTGRIITSCGIIMAGTFASLLTGTLTDLRQLGFALSCGVLLDTFVVRPILVPAFLILLAHAGNWLHDVGHSMGEMLRGHLMKRGTGH